MRPHGEHPTMGVCDCDECQQYDFEERQMKKVHKAIRWENDRGWMELRFNNEGVVTGHWKSWSGQFCHDTAPIVDRDRRLHEKQLDILLDNALSLNVDSTIIKDELLKVIGQELSVTLVQCFGDAHDSE